MVRGELGGGHLIPVLENVVCSVKTSFFKFLVRFFPIILVLYNLEQVS